MPSLRGRVFINSPRKKDEMSEESPDASKLNDLAKSANIIIFECDSRSGILIIGKTKLTISPNRVVISKRGIFTRDEYPMLIDNITNAMVYVQLGRASLTIETFGITKPDPIKNLKVSDARLARRYILGLIECKKSKVDLSGLDLEHLKEKLRDIGIVQYTTSEVDYHDL